MFDRLAQACLPQSKHVVDWWWRELRSARLQCVGAFNPALQYSGGGVVEGKRKFCSSITQFLNPFEKGLLLSSGDWLFQAPSR